MISTDWGSELEVEVPEGIQAGDDFTVSAEVTQGVHEPPAYASHMLSIECPYGCFPGDTILVTAEDGRELEVVIPDGTSAGMVFEVCAE